VTAPLEGITVVDLTRVLAGPYCTMLLAELGARVIKVENPRGGDDARHIGPFLEGRSAYFMSLNRGKESIALDLKAPEDLAIFEALLEGADVLVENFRPGALERLGYGWQELHARYPRLILAQASGFGQTGPYRERPAYDLVVQAMGGIMSLTGPAEGEPTRVGTSIGDIAAGLFTTVGVTAALHHRERSGEAIRVDVSMLDSQVALLENAVARFAATGEVPGPIGSRHPSITPFQALHARDGQLVVAAGNDALFARLCEVLGVPALAEDERFATNELRTRHVAELAEALEASLAERPVGEWLAALETAGVPCGPIQDVGQVMEDPQVVARNMIVHAEDPRAGRVAMPGSPIKLSGSEDPATRSPAPELDGDRARILAELRARS
jgi:CoA:oxalate CoA-transferase